MAFVLFYLLLPISSEITYAQAGAIGTVAWMAYWWITGPVDYAVTGLLPIAINAVFQIANVAADKVPEGKTAFGVGMSNLLSNYASSTIMLILGASLITAAWSDIGLDRRIATKFLSLIGNKMRGQLTFWFVLTTFLSAVLPNAVVCAAITPIAVSMLKFVGENDVSSSKKDEALSGSKEFFITEYKAMPKMSKAEKISLTFFLIPTVLSFCQPLYKAYLPGLQPEYLFIIFGILSFLIKKADGDRMMTWKSAEKNVVWDMIYIFGGGLAIGTMLTNSGADKVIGSVMNSLGLKGGFIMILVIVTLTVIMSDVTSNTATAAIAVPIVISMTGSNADAIPYVFAATIGVNLSYMLPTSIRAIPVGYGLSPKFMLKRGVPLTVIVIILMSVTAYVLMKIGFWTTTTL